LVDAFVGRPDVGVVSPVLLAPDSDGKHEHVDFYRGNLDRELARHDHEQSGIPYASGNWPDTDSPFVPFCATMFRSSLLREVGYLDESLGTCWEDFDMCVRIADAGYRVMTIGSARAVHFHGKTTGRTSPYIIYYLTRNRLICLFRYNRLSTIVRRAPTIARTFGWQLKKYGLDPASHKAFIRGCADFALGRRGEDPKVARMRRTDRKSQ
jgi:hypothetical protein